MSTKPLIVVLVHGWSVTNTNTYGNLPDRLMEDARKNKFPIDIRNIHLGKYVSFDDEVRLEDLSRGFAAALERDLGLGGRFACITHSTGGPVIRDWWHRYYPLEDSRQCPMSHLVMLAPANFGSALAQLGKGRLSRLKSWFDGVEPGTGVLDWLELGSPESWDLNRRWIQGEFTRRVRTTYPFVLTGQSIDRALYDHLNSYTAETGSDGVVRVASANLNATYVKLVQGTLEERTSSGAIPLKLESFATAPPTPLAVIPGRSHSGEKMGIIRSIQNNNQPHPTVGRLMECLAVANEVDYTKVIAKFEMDTENVMNAERVEARTWGPFDGYEFHDPCSMIIFRVQDDHGRTVEDFDLLLTGGPDGNPDHLPEGFFIDRQKNRRAPGTLTYFLNHSRMTGDNAFKVGRKIVRPALKGQTHLGLRLTARPENGYVSYMPAELVSSQAVLNLFVKPNQTTIVDIVMRRIIGEGVFLLTEDRQFKDFSNQKVGPPLV